MAKTSQVPSFVRLGNYLTTTLLRAGVKMGNMSLLTVRGRKSGIPRTTPVSLGERDGQRWLIAAYGIVDWVRNVRAAGEATLTRGRRSEHVFMIELAPEKAAPILKQSLAEAPGFLLKYFDMNPESSLQDFEREALKHPVFLVKSEAEMPREATTPVKEAKLN